MTLIKTSLLNGIAVMVKILAMLGINKVLALYVGPTGYAALGQFQNAVQIITQFASGAINAGVTKYTAEYNDDESKQRQVWQTAGSIAIIGSIITSVLVIVLRKSLAIWFLHDESLDGVFVWFGVTLVLFTFNALLLAILNGKKEIRLYVAANISGSLFALVATAVMVVNFGLYGALVALGVYQSLAFFVTIALCLKTRWFEWNRLIGKVHRQMLFKFAQYAMMALVSAVSIPVSQMIVRDHLGRTFGWDAAGYWEAMWRISTAYLLFVTSTLAVYYLPRLAEINNRDELVNELTDGYKVIIPVVTVAGVGMYLGRDWIIGALFSSAFQPVRELFAWQMTGDVLKIASWICSYVMIAKAMVRTYLITEILSAVGFILFVYILTDIYGIKGVVIAFALNYAIYLFVMLLVFRWYCRNGIEKHESDAL